ncbi:MAG: phenylalanine--tRNA ligase subunit alpha [Candidatus Omnitrophota bacterium]|jgi:phenylalanyl-tRNA synthetase alpha chain
MKDALKRFEEEALKEIGLSLPNRDLLETLRIKYLGRKGILTELFKKMSSLPPEDRPEIGKLINIVKENVARALNDKIKSAAATEESKDRLDITLPGISQRPGKIHPITRTISDICRIFSGLGFRVVEGPEIETEHYNFETLNIPLEHPSRDAFDTFYLKSEEKFLLRSHTSPVQTRFMEKNKPPFSIIVPGKVFRPDATDASHSFMFHQVEGLAVGSDIKFSDLKGVLNIFAKTMFGNSIQTRFRPSFFPFTEPSAEMDIRWGKGWLEILGAGMVNPKVFANVGYDPKKVTGLAFGMGVERIAMLKYGIGDIRMFFENDVRFLRQF